LLNVILYIRIEIYEHIWQVCFVPSEVKRCDRRARLIPAR
jgi:hypothetical protein